MSLLVFNKSLHVLIKRRSFQQSCIRIFPNLSMSTVEKKKSYVGAARKVSPEWSQKTMTCHSINCFSIIWGQGYAHW